jgi:hypothetical protein
VGLAASPLAPAPAGRVPSGRREPTPSEASSGSGPPDAAPLRWRSKAPPRPPRPPAPRPPPSGARG